MTTINEKDPDISGVARAWKFDSTKAREAGAARDNRDDATVAAWIVNAPWSHPIWPNVFIACIHLRDIEGQTKPPVKHLEGATHEIAVLALNPATAPEVDSERLMFLQPSNFGGQFKVDNDAAAQALTEKIVRMICEGRLNPDTDATSQWVALFGDHCFNDHYRRGIMGSINLGVMP